MDATLQRGPRALTPLLSRRRDSQRLSFREARIGSCDLRSVRDAFERLGANDAFALISEGCGLCPGIVARRDAPQSRSCCRDKALATVSGHTAFARAHSASLSAMIRPRNSLAFAVSKVARIREQVSRVQCSWSACFFSQKGVRHNNGSHGEASYYLH